MWVGARPSHRRRGDPHSRPPRVRARVADMYDERAAEDSPLVLPADARRPGPVPGLSRDHAIATSRLRRLRPSSRNRARRRSAASSSASGDGERSTFGERQLAHGVDRHDVDVHVRHLFADDQHADAHRVPLEPLGAADLLRDEEQMDGEVGIEVDPVVDLLARHDEHVARVASARSTGTRPRGRRATRTGPGTRPR